MDVNGLMMRKSIKILQCFEHINFCALQKENSYFEGQQFLHKAHDLLLQHSIIILTGTAAPWNYWARLQQIFVNEHCTCVTQKHHYSIYTTS
jgi:hypothetical protein